VESFFIHIFLCPDDCIDSRRYPQFTARSVMRELIDCLKDALNNPIRRAAAGGAVLNFKQPYEMLNKRQFVRRF
jgi:hypothetical protein